MLWQMHHLEQRDPKPASARPRGCHLQVWGCETGSKDPHVSLQRHLAGTLQTPCWNLADTLLEPCRVWHQTLAPARVLWGGSGVIRSLDVSRAQVPVQIITGNLTCNWERESRLSKHYIDYFWSHAWNWTQLWSVWRRKWQPTPVFLPGESQGQGSLVSCRLWDCIESDMTEAT